MATSALGFLPDLFQTSGELKFKPSETLGIMIWAKRGTCLYELHAFAPLPLLLKIAIKLVL